MLPSGAKTGGAFVHDPKVCVELSIMSLDSMQLAYVEYRWPMRKRSKLKSDSDSGT
jgi:hypothetical protein